MDSSDKDNAMDTSEWETPKPGCSVESEDPKFVLTDVKLFNNSQTHGSGEVDDHYGKSGSPPNVVVDDSPLQPCLDRNKESLRVKLLMRRPMNLLVEQGILPPPKTPAAYAGQRVRLERARMSDLLKIKIQQRPARQELIGQHILEDANERVAPSLMEKQRMLKRARLADSLNDHLIHRPGPLELVQKNILHASDAQIEQAIKEGAVEFKPTSEGHIPGPQVPNKYQVGDDESSSDLSSSADNSDPSTSSVVAEATPTKPGQQIENGPSCSVPMETSIGSPNAAVHGRLQLHLHCDGSNNLGIQSTIATVHPSLNPPCKSEETSRPNYQTVLPGSTLSPTSVLITSKPKRKPSKGKCAPKTRTIKFHEYKGPPNAQKGQATVQQHTESSYELLLQQQQLFLQWQLELQHKYPQIILPAVPKSESGNSQGKPNGALSSNISLLNKPTVSSFPVVASVSTTKVPSLETSLHNATDGKALTFLSENTAEPKANEGKPKPSKVQSSSEVQSVLPVKLKLDDWKVNDLKAELRRRNLPVSGSKPQLISRLRQANAGHEIANSQRPESTCSPTLVDGNNIAVDENSGSNDGMDTSCNTGDKIGCESSTSLSDKFNNPSSPKTLSTNEAEILKQVKEPQQMTSDQASLIKQQQRQILQLKNAMQNSQYQQQQLKSAPQADGQKHRIALQQHLHKKMQEQALQIHFQKFIQLTAMQQKKINDEKQTTTIAAKPIQKMVSESLVDVGSTMKNVDSTPVQTFEGKPSKGLQLHYVDTRQDKKLQQSHGNLVPASFTYEPQLFADGTWNLNSQTECEKKAADDCIKNLLTSMDSRDRAEAKMGFDSLQREQQPVKSQMVDDVLEILIRNGELPCSAAEDIHNDILNQFQANNPETHLPPPYEAHASLEGHSFEMTFIPPPPPLPPSNFSITLPTSIEFGKPELSYSFVQPSVVHSDQYEGHPNSLTFYPAIAAKQEVNSGQSTTVTNSCEPTLGTRYYGINDKKEQSSADQSKSVDIDNSQCLTLLLENVGKNLSIVDDMDVVLDDNGMEPSLLSTCQVSAHDDLSKGGSYALENTLLQDLEIPMDMDYSEWFESILPTSVLNQHNAGDSVSAHSQPSVGCAYDNSCSSNILNNNNDFTNSCNNLGPRTHCNSPPIPIHNYNSASQLTRDPLLSSTRHVENPDITDASQRISLASVGTGNNGEIPSVTADTKLNVPGLMSPVTDAVLWDFAM